MGTGVVTGLVTDDWFSEWQQHACMAAKFAKVDCLCIRTQGAGLVTDGWVLYRIMPPELAFCTIRMPIPQAYHLIKVNLRQS